MISTLIYSIVKLLLGIGAVVFGFIIGLLLLGVSLPTGLYYQLGRFWDFIKQKCKLK
jgi:hypothetical protein